jgi:hypothetical protein
MEYDISFSGEDLLHSLKPRQRIDLFLKIKECLVNHKHGRLIFFA